MPDVLPGVDAFGVPIAPPEPRAALFWDGTYWRVASVDAAGHIQIDVQTILGLEGALQSVTTDRLIVRGEDQLHSFAGVLANTNSAIISGADGRGDSLIVPDGVVWHVTHIFARDDTSPTTAHSYAVRHDAATVYYHDEIAAFAAGVASDFPTNVWLDPGDVIRVLFTGGLVGDTCTVRLIGEIMTLET